MSKESRMKKLIILLLTSFSFATVINIPDDYSTIQEGIDASVNGDTVLVQPETYYENINFNGHNISLGSLFLTTSDTSYISQTIIDGGGVSNVVRIEDLAGQIQLSGLSIINGNANGEYPYQFGGGILCVNSNPNIKNCYIYDNVSQGSGGGINIMGSSSPVIENCRINNNTAINITSDGGGLGCHNANTITILNSEINNNNAFSGGGIYTNSCNLDLSYVTISNNEANVNSNSHGGGIIDGGHESIYNNVSITDNFASGLGGGLSRASHAILNNVTLAGNTSIIGGVINFENSATMVNCIIWGNIDGNEFFMGESNISFSNIDGGWSGNGENNINADPLFYNVEIGDYSLQINSPCIDAGDPESEFDPDGTIADIGAYYYHQESGCTDPVALNYDPDAIINDGSCEYSCIDIDENVYETIIIGDQEWMAENLKVTHYRNGDEIPTGYNNEEWITITNGAYSVYDNDPNYAEVHGNLYNWYSANDQRNIAPEGWHVPTDDEFKELELFLGMSQTEVDGTGWRGTNEGSKLAGNAELWDGGELENNEEFGLSNFLALPSGYRHAAWGTFEDIGVYSQIWSSTNGNSTHAWERTLNYNQTEVSREMVLIRSGFSIRCIRDSEIEDIYGCTDPFAINFNPDANLDDGNCEYDDNANYSIDFDGVNSFVEIPDTDNLDMNLSDFTIEAWVLNRNENDEKYIIGKMDGTRNGYGLVKNQDGRLISTFRKEGIYSDAVINVVSDPIELNIWYHVTGVLDRDVGAKLYINGELADEVFDTKLENIQINNSEILAVGKLYGYGAITPFDGLIDDVKIWNFARTSDQVLTSFLTSTQESEDGLVGYWNFNEGSGNSLQDLSGNNNNGTINGAVWSNNVPALGCTDSDALNYDPSADFDDDTCTYLEGCTDPLALNYDPDAIVDDGSCLYGEAGCMDEIAYNFNENAEWNDGSCIYYGDINADGNIDVVDVIDMVGFVLEFVEPTPEEILLGDLYPDGQINIYDIVGVVSIIMSDSLLDTLPLTEVTLIQEHHSLKFSKTGSIAGIRIEYEGEFESSLEGWMIEKNENTILMISLDGSDIETLYYSGDLKINSCSVVDWELNKIHAEVIVIPDQFSLKPAFPNPFNPVTTFSYDIPYDAYVVIKAFDVKGNEVAELVNGMIEEGNHKVIWDASKLSSGMYFVRMTSGDYKGVQKIIYLK
jgi:uncharacterized protein (TIGR02145 family)